MNSEQGYLNKSLAEQNTEWRMKQSNSVSINITVTYIVTAVAVEVLLKCCINSFAHKNKLIWQLMELFTNLKNLIILVTSCFVVIGHLCQS